MAMRAKVWTLSGLEVETGRDRRTIARALRGVPPDGKIEGRHDAWFLRTALAALDRLDTPSTRPAASRAGQSGEGPLSHFVNRVEDWRKIRAMFKPGEKGKTYDIIMTAQIFGVEPAAILMWLRAGMPYEREGCWE